MEYHSQKIPSKPWKENYSPTRILAIRLHAIGDVVITFPYLTQLKKSLPAGAQIRFVDKKRN